MKGRIVRWEGANGIVQGALVREAGPHKGDWLVSLGSGKFVVINEESFKKYDERGAVGKNAMR